MRLRLAQNPGRTMSARTIAINVEFLVDSDDCPKMINLEKMVIDGGSDILDSISNTAIYEIEKKILEQLKNEADSSMIDSAGQY